MATQANLAEIEDAEEDEANLKTVTDILPEIGTICRVCREVGKFEVWKILSFRDSIVFLFISFFLCNKTHFFLFSFHLNYLTSMASARVCQRVPALRRGLLF